MKRKRQFVLCIRNDKCDDIELRKVYEVIPDDDAAKDNFLRIIDESGEDYLYPSNFFITIDLPKSAENALTVAP